ncbi:hypothetical protein PHYSODRAFT_410324, partial [Phytophthora sojae]
NAVEHGHPEVARWLYTNAPHEVNDRVLSESLLQATVYGHLDAMKWLMERYPSSYREQEDVILESAVQHGHLTIADFLSGLNAPSKTTTKLMDLAAENGHWNMLEWLHGRWGCSCSTDAMDAAATNGYSEVVKWLNYHRTEGCTTAAMDGAAQNGHLEVIKWLYRHRSEGCTGDAIVNAAFGYLVRVVAWLQDHYPE